MGIFRTNKRPADSYVSGINAQPKDSLNLSVVVPANSSNALLNFSRGFNFDGNDFNIITQVKMFIDTSALYNIQDTEMIVLTSGPSTVVINPGYYTISDVMTLLGVNIPISGANSLKTTTGGSGLQFDIGSEMAVILGYSENPPTSLLTIPPLTISPFITDFTGIFDIVNVRASFTNSANSFGNNYLASLLIQPTIVGQLVQATETCQKPIISTAVSSLYIDLFNKYDQPYTTLADMLVILTINIYDKYDY